MWLQPLLPRLARVAAFAYYRIRYRGAAVPPHGAALLVANHPNSLLDPVLVAAAARRPLRFLAKAPLFSDAKVGWLMRAAGAIPTYRRSDDPALVGRNDEMFRAVEAALAAGDAVALFPEGISHSEPSLAPLRTGAARIALGAAIRRGGSFPVVPVGLVLRRKEVFRSEAVVLVGSPIPWDDLAGRGSDDGEAVRDLTARLDQALRSLTINLDAWRDAPVVETAMRVWEAERAAIPDDAERVARQRVTAGILARVRASGDPEGLELAHDIATHRRRLDRLGLRPHDLVADVGGGRAVRWTTARLPLLFPLAGALATAGWLLFLVPYRITARVIGRLPLAVDTIATWKLMLGAVIHSLWVVILALAAAALGGWWWGLGTLIVTPLVGMGGLLVRERWRGSWRDARRWLLLRTRRSLAATLRQEQRELAHRLDDILRRMREDTLAA